MKSPGHINKTDDGLTQVLSIVGCENDNLVEQTTSGLYTFIVTGSKSRTPGPGAVYSGLVVGALGPGGVIRPVLERWPDLRGVFSMVLPGSARGKTISLWENQRQFYSRLAGRPGGPVDLGSWPRQLGEAAASPVATLRLP